MNRLPSALWTEALKVYRSKVLLFTFIAFALIPVAGGLFLIILKDPEAAKSAGLINAKAQITMGTADWPTYLNLLSTALAAGGLILFSIIPIWVFGRESSEHTIKELLSLPTSRDTIVTAKFIITFFWMFFLALFLFGVGILIGTAVVIPGWSAELLKTSFGDALAGTLLALALMPLVAFFASLGRGYLLPFGWTFLTLFLAEIVGRLGWGDWFPWSVPVLFSGAAGPRTEAFGMHSYVMVVLAGLMGFVATFYWWRSADQTK